MTITYNQLKAKLTGTLETGRIGTAYLDRSVMYEEEVIRIHSEQGIWVAWVTLDDHYHLRGARSFSSDRMSCLREHTPFSLSMDRDLSAFRCAVTIDGLGTFVGAFDCLELTMSGELIKNDAYKLWLSDNLVRPILPIRGTIIGERRLSEIINGNDNEPIRAPLDLAPPLSCQMDENVPLWTRPLPRPRNLIEQMRVEMEDIIFERENNTPF